LYFIDIQGTLISDIDKTPLPGALEFIERLNKESVPYILITNNTKQSSNDFIQFLQAQGFAIDKEHYIDPLMVLKASLQEKLIAPYGSDAFIQNLQNMGYQINYQTPQAVVVAIKEDFTAEEYAQMIEALLNGAKLVGMHETSLYAKNNKRYPGVGAILKMLSFATQKEYAVVGKPSELFYQKALTLLQQQNKNATFEDITIISDDVVGDLIGAKKLGMKTIFVLSGKFKTKEEILPALSIQPDEIYKNISELL